MRRRWAGNTQVSGEDKEIKELEAELNDLDGVTAKTLNICGE